MWDGDEEIQHELVRPELRVPMSLSDPELFKGLLDQITDGVNVLDGELRVLYCNEAAVRLTGYRSEEVAGRTCRENGQCPIGSDGISLCKEGCFLASSVRGAAPKETGAILIHKQGWRIPVEIHVQPVRSGDGALVGTVEILVDDSARHKARRKAEAMERLAFLDPLTETPNRRFLEMALHTALREYQVTKAPFGVLFLDLDNFKSINDLFGHEFGDRALRQVARTLHGTMRPTDTVGRWGGDEFLAILREVNEDVLRRLSDRCGLNVARTSLSGEGGQPICLSISIGGTLVGPEDTVQRLIRRGDRLMYESKSNGKHRATIG